MTIKVPGKITISRCWGGDTDEIRVTLQDEVSGCQIVEARLSLENFTKAVTAQAYIDCELEVYNKAPVGKKREHKEEWVPYKSEYHKRDDKLEKLKDKALAPFEVDGWHCGYRDDLGNHHKYSKRKINGKEVEGYTIGFVRWVD